MVVSRPAEVAFGSITTDPPSLAHHDVRFDPESDQDRAATQYVAMGQKQKSANPDSIGALARNRTKGDTKTSMQDCSNQSGNPSSSTLSGAGRVEEARQAYAEMMHNYPDLLRYIQRAFGRSWSARR